jgi:hypothetical protein
MMAWFSSAAGKRGVVAQGVNANGSPAGPAMTMPGSQVMQGGGTVSKTPIVARADNGGFYVAYALGYPTANRVRVWRVGASAAKLLARTDANSQVTLAADATGRIWAVWSDGTFGDTHVLAARSNRQATRFGARVDAGAVRGATVRAAGLSGRTDRRGRVVLRLKRGRATARARGYAPATLRVR